MNLDVSCYCAVICVSLICRFLAVRETRGNLCISRAYEEDRKQSVFPLSNSICISLLQVSVLTTLERRFNLQSADVGVIASSFEIGNLALILFVSYFGARGHRPRLIGCGGIVMALGALLSALPEFLTHQYEYESGEIRWGAEGRDVCAANGSTSDEGPDPDLICRNRTATNMMYLLLIGAQVLLGIGATPVQPLGVSYIDDHVRRKDSSLYIGEAR